MGLFFAHCTFSPTLLSFSSFSPPTPPFIMPAKGGKPRKQVPDEKTFVIDCSLPAEEGIFDVPKFEEYLQARVKVNGKTGQLAGAIEISRSGNKVPVHSLNKTRLPKKYLKYLAKKFLCKHEIRDYVRVVASNSTTYELRYFNVNADEEEEADE